MRRFCTAAQSFVRVEHRGPVALVTLTRSKQLNALCDGLIKQLNHEMSVLDDDDNIGAIVLTGEGRAFAAGADLKEMNTRENFAAVNKERMLESWDNLRTVRKPIVAAVNGFALGGGCELAMLCDIVIASDKATFGQPEVLVGTIPGCGGTQRLVRAVGKSKAMEWILTGDQFTAAEAEKAGLVSKVVASEEVVEEAMKTAGKIAKLSRPIVAMAKECVNEAYETTLSEGVRFEKRVFHSTWALEDRREGMQAFGEKRKPDFQHK